MAWEHDDRLERGGDCNDCGEPVEEDHHAYCPACFRRHQGWDDDDPNGGERQPAP